MIPLTNRAALFSIRILKHFDFCGEIFEYGTADGDFRIAVFSKQNISVGGTADVTGSGKLLFNHCTDGFHLGTV